MKKFEHVLDICFFLDDHFGWYCDTIDENVVKVGKPDGDIETIPKEELENIALEMWESLKMNGLDKDFINDVESEYFTK